VSSGTDPNPEPSLTIERHPLLAAGGGQNARMLPDEAVVAYCDALGDRLSHLGAALAAEQKEGRISIAALQAARAFLQEIRATLLVMALKHGRQLLDVEPLPLTIDPTESGMPTFKDFWTLREDRDHAEEQLKQIPAREQLIDQAADTIFAGNRPIKQQILWLQRSYMERLAATPVVADFRQREPVCLDGKRRDKLYAVSWTGVIHSVNLFECCTLHFVESGGWHVTGGTSELRDLVDDLAGGRHTLQEMVGLINQAPWVVPQTTIWWRARSRRPTARSRSCCALRSSAPPRPARSSPACSMCCSAASRWRPAPRCATGCCWCHWRSSSSSATRTKMGSPAPCTA
jgi:hypothetical protein